jgi:hypothetical protein
MEMRTTGKKQLVEVANLLSAFEKATGPEKDKAWDAIAAALKSYGPESAHSKKLVPTVRAALTSDPDNAKGQKKRAVAALLAANVADEPIITAAIALDPKNADGMYEQAVLAMFMSLEDDDGAKAALEACTKLDATGPLKDKKVAVEVYARAALIAFNVTKDVDKAKVYAKKAKDLGSDNESLIAAMDNILAK